MTAKDRWSVKVSCRPCGTSGVANLWQEDGWSFAKGDQSTHVGSVPEGFRAVRGQGRDNYIVDFFCLGCGQKADEDHL